MDQTFSLSRWAGRVSLVSILLLPYFFLVGRVDRWEFPPLEEWFSIFSFTLKQAFLSGLAIFTVGYLGAVGLIHWKKHREILESILTLPNAIPPLFLILSLLNIVDPFPFGLVGIIVAHTAMNAGLATVLVLRVFESKVSGWAELALIEGASFWGFHKVIVRALSRDLALVFLFFFSICFSSFAIPLVLGAVGETTLEVLVLEKLKIDGSWSRALGLSALQSTVLFIFVVLLSKQKSLSKILDILET